jgi:hypothetical protein
MKREDVRREKSIRLSRFTSSRFCNHIGRILNPSGRCSGVGFESRIKRTI